MSKKALLISGWGQKPDVLNDVVPEGFLKSALDYAVYPSKEGLLKSIKTPIEVELVIGWSLGGQLAMELIQEGFITAKCLVLIAAPYQFVNEDTRAFAVSEETLKQFVKDYDSGASEMLSRFGAFIAKGDKNTKQVIKNLIPYSEQTALQNLRYWLLHLKSFSAQKMDVSRFPATCIIHGKDDAITHVAQAQMLHDVLKNSRLEIFENCGHAPHLHDALRVKNLIAEAAVHAGI